MFRPLTDGIVKFPTKVLYDFNQKIQLPPTIGSFRIKLCRAGFGSRDNSTLIPYNLRVLLPDERWSPAQQANRQRFREAVRLAHQALTDPAQRKKYEKMAAGTGRRVIDVAISDHLHKLKKKLTT